MLNVDLILTVNQFQFVSKIHSNPDFSIVEESNTHSKTFKLGKEKTEETERER